MKSKSTASAFSRLARKVDAFLCVDSAVGGLREGPTAVDGPGTDRVNLAMYTFRVGPWLPVDSVISADLTRRPEEGETRNFTLVTVQ